MYVHARYTLACMHIYVHARYTLACMCMYVYSTVAYIRCRYNGVFAYLFAVDSVGQRLAIVSNDLVDHHLALALHLLICVYSNNHNNYVHVFYHRESSVYSQGLITCVCALSLHDYNR